MSLHNIESEILHIFMQTANTAFNLSSNPVPTIFEVTQVTGNKEPKLLGFIKKRKKLIMLGISHTLAPSMNQSCALADLRTNVCDPAILQYCNSIPQWIDCLFSPKSMFSIIECSILM